MKLTYSYKELFYKVKDIEEICKYIKDTLVGKSPCDRVHLEYDGQVIWSENYFGGNYSVDAPDLYEALEKLRKEVKESVFFSYKLEKGKFDVYFTLITKKGNDYNSWTLNVLNAGKK